MFLRILGIASLALLVVATSVDATTRQGVLQATTSSDVKKMHDSQSKAHHNLARIKRRRVVDTAAAQRRRHHHSHTAGEFKLCLSTMVKVASSVQHLHAAFNMAQTLSAAEQKVWPAGNTDSCTFNGNLFFNIGKGDKSVSSTVVGGGCPNKIADKLAAEINSKEDRVFNVDVIPDHHITLLTSGDNVCAVQAYQHLYTALGFLTSIDLQAPNTINDAKASAKLGRTRDFWKTSKALKDVVGASGMCLPKATVVPKLKALCSGGDAADEAFGLLFGGEGKGSATIVAFSYATLDSATCSTFIEKKIAPVLKADGGKMYCADKKADGKCK